MKTSLFLMLFALLSSTTFSQSEHHCSYLKSHGAEYERSATLSDEYIALTNEYDVNFYFLDLYIERTATDVSGTVEIHVTTLAPVLDSFLFELHENLVISSLKLNGITTMAYTREGSAVIVPVDFEIGDAFFMEITYAGTPPTGVDAFSRGMSNETSGAWGNQVTWSLSEPFYAYEWFPNKQSLTDKADSSWVFVTTDASNMVGSNGLLTQVVDLDFGKQRYEWKSNYPIEYYLISIAVAEYIEYTIYAEPDGADDPIMIQNFIYNNTLTLPYFEDAINNTADFVELFSDLYGLYPFANEKYGHCMAPIGGGMEHQTMTTQGYFDDWLTAHELGHQWFGDNVTCASWQDIWLNEGFASYSEELMMETYTSGDETGHMFDRHTNIMSETGGSVWVEDTLNKGRIFNGRLTYNKGAAIVHTLRFLINNDDLFFEVLETYQTTFAGSTVTLADFKGVAEDVTGMDFTNFFNEWYYGEGYVKYSIEYALVDEILIIVLKQETSKPTSVPYFTNDLEIRVLGIDGEYSMHRLENVDGETSFHYIPYTQDIINIYIDPNNWIINRIGSINENENLASLIESKQVEFKLYPNPTTNSITIENGNKTSEYSIYDEAGKKVMEGQVSSGNNTIQVGELSKGNYFIRIDGEERIFSKI